MWSSDFKVFGGCKLQGLIRGIGLSGSSALRLESVVALASGLFDMHSAGVDVCVQERNGGTCIFDGRGVVAWASWKRRRVDEELEVGTGSRAARSHAGLVSVTRKPRGRLDVTVTSPRGCPTRTSTRAGPCL